MLRLPRVVLGLAVGSMASLYTPAALAAKAGATRLDPARPDDARMIQRKQTVFLALAALLAGEAYFAAVLFALARALTQPGF